MQIEWTKQAIEDISEIEDYISLDRPAAAKRVAAHLWSSVEHLAEFLELGKPGRRPGTRSLIVPPYVITYRVLSCRVEILSVWHSRRAL